jgi:hypothetical protein
MLFIYVFRRNYCKSSEDFIEKMEQWSREHNSDEEEVRNIKYYQLIFSNET